MKPKGFTLIELLVVIAILAVLAVAVVLVLNPAELIRQARDTTRISDIAAVNSAIALYLADVSTATFTDTGRCTVGTAQPPGMTQTCSNSTSTAVNGNGWVPINFGGISSGSPLPRLPIDPVNAASANCDGGGVNVCMYVFASDAETTTYELNANMESDKYESGGGSDVESNDVDGGDDDDWYEVGSALDL